MTVSIESVEWANVAAHATREQYLDDIADQLNSGALTVVTPTMFCFSHHSPMDADPLLGQVTLRPVLPGGDTADAITAMGNFAARCRADLVLMFWDNQWLHASLGTTETPLPGIVSLTADRVSHEVTLHAVEPQDRRWARITIGSPLPDPIHKALSAWRSAEFVSLGLCLARSCAIEA